MTLETLLELSIIALTKYRKELQSHNAELACDAHVGLFGQSFKHVDINVFSLIT